MGLWEPHADLLIDVRICSGSFHQNVDSNFVIGRLVREVLDHHLEALHAGLKLFTQQNISRA